jgi:hypothetical protein
LNSSTPDSNSKLATSPGAPAFEPGTRHISRPAIIKCSTKNISPSSSSTTRLPSRRTSTRRRHPASDKSGTAVRNRNGLLSRTRCST